MALTERKALSVHKVLKALLVQLVPKVRKVLPVLRVPLALPVSALSLLRVL
jgi:hypothetical protein